MLEDALGDEHPQLVVSLIEIAAVASAIATNEETRRRHQKVLNAFRVCCITQKKLCHASKLVHSSVRLTYIVARIRAVAGTPPTPRCACKL